MENNTHSGNGLHNPDVHHEPGDVDAPFLTKFGLGMSALIIVFMFGLWGMFDYLKNRVTEIEEPEHPSAIVNTQKQPPAPRLQAHPAEDMRKFRAAEERSMDQYGWIDPDKGIVQIPVDRAMDLIAQRGLPAPPAQPAGKGK